MSKLLNELEKDTTIPDKDVDIDCKYKYCEKCLCVNKSKFNSFKYKLCKDYPNCYTKQLRRKEQECEKYEQALNEIEKYLDAQQKYFDGEDYHNLLDIINKAKGAVMTANREKLNTITNEKLARIFACSDDESVCEYCVYNNRCNRGTISCYEGILQWLNQK